MKSTDPEFEGCWRELRPQLERLLRGRGANPDVADDVLQETAIRLLKSWGRLDHGRSIGPFARTIAINCLIDLHRGQRAIPVEDVPDAPSVYDLEEHALARARLTTVEAVLDDLMPRDRTVLLAEVGMGERLDNPATKMARMRARRRLTAAMDRVAAAFGGVQLGWRRAGFWFQELKPAGESLLPIAASVVAVAVLGTTPGIIQADQRPPRRMVRIETIAAKRPHRHHESRVRTVLERDPQPVREEGEAADASASAPRPRPSPSESTVVDTGDASVRTRDGQGYKGVEVCRESTVNEADDGSTAVVVYDGTQHGSQPDSCS
jgi:RNA polymerase sigma factor (sigma-70 family)